MEVSKEKLLERNQILERQLQEYKELVDAIKNGSIDALAINKDGVHNIFTLESNDYVYRVLVENFAESALNLTETGLIIYANTAFENLLGQTSSTIIGTDFESLVEKKYRLEFKKLFANAFSGTSKGEILLAYKEKIIPVSISLSSLYPKFNGIGMIISDLTQKKQQQRRTNELEDKVSEHSSFIQLILDSSVELITTFDKDLNYTSLNKIAAEYMGMQPDEVIGKNFLEIYPQLDHSEHYKRLKRALSGETIRDRQSPGIKRSNFYFDTYFKPIFLNNEVIGVLRMERDITLTVESKKQLEDVNRELESKNLALIHGNTELSSYNYIASHDLQVPLKKINLEARALAETEKGISTEVKNYLANVMEATEKMQNMLGLLLTYSKVSSLKSEYSRINLNNILEDVKKRMSKEIKKSDVVIESAKLPTLPGMEMQLHQVFSNLISNSIKYSKKTERPYIKIISEFISEKDIQNEVDLLKGKYWKITFSDNGIGIDNSFGDRIFKLFKQIETDEHNKDNPGIGLSVCQKIVQNHNGTITVNGLPNKGTSFNVYLPA